MKIEKKINARRSILAGCINKIVTLLLPFAVQTLLIHKLGLEYVGIKGLYTSILTVLSLSELGVGNAIVYSMYKPVAEDDYERISSLLNLYKKIYKIIGVIVLLCGLLLTPFLKFLIKGNYPSEINIYVIFLLYLANTVISYLMFGYKSSLLNSYQRTDVISNIGTISSAIVSLAQILILAVLPNFYVYLICMIAGTMINNLIVSFTVDRLFPNIKCEGQVDKTTIKDIKEKVGGLLIGKICWTTRNTFDSIFMSMFIGLTAAGIYSNYYYIITVLNGFTTLILTSILAGIGNSIVLDSKDKNYDMMLLLDDAYMMLCGWMTIFMLCIYQPFMQIWAGENYMFADAVMYLFVIYFFVSKKGDIRGVYSDAAGLFWENRYRNIAESLANILLNYILVIYLGAFGVLLASIIAIITFGYFGGALVIFRHYFNKGLNKYLFVQVKHTVVTLTLGALTYMLCGYIHSYNLLITIILRLIICAVVPSFIYIMIRRKSPEFQKLVVWLADIIGFNAFKKIANIICKG